MYLLCILSQKLILPHPKPKPTGKNSYALGRPFYIIKRNLHPEHQTLGSNENGHASGHTNSISNGANGSKGNHTNGHANGLSDGPSGTPVAICGMAMRLPSGIRNDNDLYKFLFNKQDARSPIGADRYNVDAFYSPYGQDRSISTNKGYFLNDLDYSNLDLSMFTFSAAEAEQLDPNHRLVLEIVRKAFESVGESEWRRKNIGTYVGLFTEDWQEIDHKDNQEYNSHRIMGGTDFALPNRIAYEYDLKGPSMLFCGNRLHEALEAIRQEEITAALTMGSNLILGSLSPEGSPKSCHSDGKTNGITMPNGEAHVALIRQAYGAIGLDMAGTAMVEAHGTGTKVGDPIEVGAIGRCLKHGIYLGVSKPNLSHSEGAAALTSVMKATLSLENRTILPNIKFNYPNPRIPWDALKLTVPLEPTPWPENEAERISVDSYGIGGSNVHLIINRISENIEAYLNTHPERIDDTAYTLAQRREHMKLRNFSVFQGPSEPFEVSARTRYQGAQWVHVGRELMYEYPTFLDNIRSSDKVLQSLKHAPSWSIEAEFSQPLCTALQIALVDLPATWSITPSAVVGHSSGELEAAYAAGALSAKDAIIAAFYRGQVCKTAKQTGVMAAVGLGKEDVSPYLASGVRVACENSGSSITLSGDLEVLEKVMAKIKEARLAVLVRKLQVEMAYHSRKPTDHMTLIGDDYRELIAEHLLPRTPKIPFYSSVRAKVLHEASDFGPRYWQDNLESPLKECAVHLEGINYVSILNRSNDDTVSFPQAVGQLHSLGVKISYPAGFEEKNWRFRKHLPHDLLGICILEGSDVAPSWRNVLRTINGPWLNDHCIGDDTIFPAAISGVREYTVRDVKISKALLLYNDKSVEVVTNVQPHRFTSDSDSDWYTFQIVSHDGSTWNKHCSGLVRSDRASPLPPKRNQSLDRKVSSSRWYTTMSRVGLNYTGKFARLENIAASVTEPIASADVVDKQERLASPLFQSLTVAKARGIHRDFNKLFLPTFIEGLYVGDGRNKAVQINTASLGKSDAVQGDSYGTSNGEVVFSLKGFQGKPMINSGADKLTVLCAIETRNAISGITATQPHLEKFRNWLNSEYERYQKPGYPLVEDSRDLVRMDATERRGLIEKVFKRCEAVGGWANAIAIYRGYVNAADVFEGRSSMLDILLQDGVLAGVYRWMNDIWEFKDYIQLLGHAQPQITILEIGAGTGGLIAKFLEHLISDYGERLYFKYTFSDISSGFFVQAQERFKEYAGIEYQALDISQNPLEQGFKAGEYDLIVASNVLHATPCLHDTLTNVRTLLKPEGQLFLQEICPVTQTMSYSIGDTFEEFSGCSSVTTDYEHPYTWMANIIAKPAIQYSSLQKVTLLHSSKKNSYVAEVKNDIGKDDLTRLLHKVDSCQHFNIIWLMPAAQIIPTGPYAGQMLGLMRTIRSELAASFATLELEDTGLGAARAVANVLTKVQRSKDTEDELDVDMVWAWANGALNVGRFHWIPVNKDLCKTAKTPTAKGLTIRTPGLLQTLEWTSQPLGDPAPEEVHIKMTAVGLNYGDVLSATGANAGDSTFGLEGVGYITKLGSKVTNFTVGDRIMTVGANSVGMATVIRRPAQLCIKIPDQLSDEEAATMPLVYVTILLFPVERWKLSKGQSILIHSAARGIGICAIHVAKWLGAEIYATVGSEDKASFLAKEFGIPRNCCFNSRDTSFLQGTMEATHGSGVDLVLNSLSGELLSASWKCVARDGAMIEIEKRDMTGKGQLALAPFEDNRTFLGGDATRFIATHKSTVARLLELLVKHYLKGDFKPITPITSFDAENIEEAFKYLQKGSHIGKIVIKLPQNNTLPLVPIFPLPEFRSDATYVLVGGLGGVGKAIAGWMASYGAKNLIFLSFFAVDITDATAVKEAVSHATLPIAGVMHMAMVLADRGIFDMDLETWNKALLPKDMDFLVLFSSNSGTHGFYGQSNYASGNTFLDAFSQYRQNLGLPASVTSIGPIDDIGFVSLHASMKETLVQKVANLLWETSFLDTLQLAIARSSTKYAPQLISVELPFSGYQAPNHIFHAPEGSAPVMDAEEGAMWMWKRDARLAIYRNIQKVSTVVSTRSGNQLKQFLSSMAKEPSKLDQKSSADIITKELGNCISNFLMKGDEAIDLSLSLSAAGVDSLVVIEIRNWWKQNLGTNVSVLELLGGGSVEQLGTMAAQRLKAKYTTK
ncbi:putative polyketide synthase [Bisporella sp. PMI_857]|nr:putative polyketide synthase [Bisporella sp. PMI_857]